MATKKTSSKKTTPKKAAPAKKTTPKAAPAEKATTKKAPATKAPATKASATKAPATKADATKAPVTKAPMVKAAATKAPATKALAKKAPAKKAPAQATTGGAAPGEITLEEAKRIVVEVLAKRKEPKGSCRAALPLTFRNVRRPNAASELSPLEQRQIIAAGADGMGEARTPSGWLDPDDESYHDSLEVWDVVDAKGIPVYSVWMYLTDNGTVFRAGTIDVVGGVSQGGLECAEEGLEEALLEAKERVDKASLNSSFLRFID